MAKTKLKVLNTLSKHADHQLHANSEVVTNYANGDNYEDIELWCVDCQQTVVRGHVYNDSEVENFSHD